MKSLSLHRDEVPDGGHVRIIRLAESAVQNAQVGDECVLRDRNRQRMIRGRVEGVETKRLRELTDTDAQQLTASGAGSLAELRLKLEQYRFRPQWEGESTEFRILEISVDG